MIMRQLPTEASNKMPNYYISRLDVTVSLSKVALKLYSCVPFIHTEGYHRNDFFLLMEFMPIDLFSY